MRRRALGLLIAFSLLTGCARDDDRVPRPAIEAITRALADHAIVAIGETHGSAQLSAFLLELVRDREFRRAARLIAVEVSQSAQPVIDAYLGGRAGDQALLDALRDGTFSASGAADPRSIDLYRTIRDGNAGLPDDERLRVLAADAPFSWRAARTPQDLAVDREAAMARLLTGEVVATGTHALWVVGGAHVGPARATITRDHPGSFYALSLYTGFGPRTAELEGRTAAWPVPGVIPVTGTWLADLSDADLGAPGAPGDVMIGGPAQPERTFGETTDGLLYLGRAASLTALVPDRSVFADSRYLAELNRRTRLTNGRDFDVEEYYRFARSLFAGH